MPLTLEEQQKLKEYTQGIAEILYRNAQAENEEQLKTLEGIELAVRKQLLDHVSPNVGNFLSKQALEQKQAKKDI